MKKMLAAIVVVTMGFTYSAQAQEKEEVCEALFVHNAKSVAMVGTTITMTGASPTVISASRGPVTASP